MSPRFFIIVFFVLTWAGVSGSFSLANLLFGLLLGLFALRLVHEKSTKSGKKRLHGIAALRLALLFLIELLKSGLRVARLVLTPRMNLRPAVIAYPLRLKEAFEITLLANLITLTPGTLSVDVSEDRRLLYIHCVDVDDYDALIADIRDGFEAKIQEVFR